MRRTPNAPRGSTAGEPGRAGQGLATNRPGSALRVLFLTSTAPVPTWGGAMAFYRHFVERSDFAVLVATDDAQVDQHTLPCPVYRFSAPKWLERAGRTRLGLWAHSLKHLAAGRFVPEALLKTARDFRPDLVQTVAGSWFWTATLAQRVARELKVPLVASFNDWFDYNILLHPALRGSLERKFRRFYAECDLALCTSEGMREELGEHANPHILYPTGASLPQGTSEFQPFCGDGKDAPFVVAFAGNLANWYGRMLEQLVSEAWQRKLPVEFRLFGSNPSWSSSFDREVRARGVYRGQLPFAELKGAMAQVNALLLLMGFGQDCALIEKTSFKTKFLDYLSFQKPILLWGPEYCSATRIAREFDAAATCADAEAASFLETISALGRSPERQTELVNNARKMYEDRFHPDRIHTAFVQKCRELVESSAHGRA
jgi:glycosyltransferase involved in cell wall biosynthesis